jgi:hypothetical protein
MRLAALAAFAGLSSACIAPEDQSTAPTDTARGSDVATERRDVGTGADAPAGLDSEPPSGDAPEDDAAGDATTTPDDGPAPGDAADEGDATSPDPDIAADTTPPEAPVDPTVEGPWPLAQEALEVDGFEVALFVPTASVTVPAVVLAPGFQLDGDAFFGFARHLASHGVAVLVPTFGDGIFSAIDHADLSDAVIAMVDALAGDPRFDPERLGAGGHSRGGKVALLAATRDGRIRASFNLDPVDATGPGVRVDEDNPSVAPELMGNLAIPLGFVGTTRGGRTTLPGAPACAPSGENYAAYAGAAPTPPFVAVPPESGHNDFADPLPLLLRLACAAGQDPAAVRGAAKTWMTAFYRLHLAGDARYAPWLANPPAP